MRKLLLIAACALMVPVGACSTLPAGDIASPASYANMTKADEQLAVSSELAYKLWRKAVEAGVNANIIAGRRAAITADLDNQLYAALQVVEKAYAAGNAADFRAAVDNFNAAATHANAVFEGSK